MKETEKDFLQNYSPDQYDRISIAADVLVFTVTGEKLQILLIRRDEFPYKDRLAVPGGFVRSEETAEEAAEKRLKEETGVEGIYLEQLYTFSGIHRDPRMRIISVSYLGIASGSVLEKRYAGERTSKIGIYTLEYDPSRGFCLLPCETGGHAVRLSELAFDHGEMIALAVERMRGKLEYTDIAFAFLEDKQAFTLAELQKVYEAIAGKKYDTPNFRRFVKSRYEDKGKIVKTKAVRAGSGKAAALYRLA